MHNLSVDFMENHKNTKDNHSVEKSQLIEGMIRRDGSASFLSMDPGYKWDVGEQSKDLQTAFISMLYGAQPALVIGPSGTGKTLAVKQLAYDLSMGRSMRMHGGSMSTNIETAKLAGHDLKTDFTRPVPLVVCQGTPDTTYSELCGWWQPIDGGVRFIEGILPEAVRLANERGLSMLLVDEINAIRPEYQKALNSLLADRKVIFADRSWELDRGVKLLMVATMNDFAVGYGGINGMNEDLERRFGLKVVMGYPKADEEKAILMGYTMDTALINKLILLAQHTRGSEGGLKADPTMPFSRPVSTADLTNFLVAYKNNIEVYASSAFALESSLRMSLLNKYHSQSDSDERKAFREKIADIFGVELRD